MKAASEASLIGIVVYDGVEPIDIGGTVGVISMASRVLPALRYVIIAERSGPVRLAGGLTILADHDFRTAPVCDRYIVTGGAGWREQTANAQMLGFLARQPPARLASVCTGALILAASGRLAGKTATTRRRAVGGEKHAPIELLGAAGNLGAATVAALVDDGGTVTTGGVSLATDGTLYVLGLLYGDAMREQVASIIEYDRAYAANRHALGHLRAREASR